VKKIRILIIDDEESLCRMFKMNLEKAGSYTADTAASAEEGFARLGERHYDMIFLDVLMPQIEGGEALQRIKKMTPTPVVIMSAYLPPDRLEAIHQAGAFDIIEKPFDFSLVLDLIHKGLAAQEKARIH
jgi:DNA-binding NtrC family response regulator